VTTRGTTHDSEQRTVTALDAAELARRLRTAGFRVFADTWTDARGAAHVLTISTRTLRTWAATGRGPRPLQPGRITIYAIDELLEHVQRSAVAGDEHDDRPQPEVRGS
jgi:hypothetical protein